MSDSVYKKISQLEDMRVVQRVATQELFGNKQFTSIPFTENNGYELKSSSLPSTDTEYYNKIYFINKSGSSSTYFSYIDAKSSSYDQSTGSNGAGISYWNFTKLMYPHSSEYKINDGNYSGSTSEMTILSVNREYYKDGIKPDLFSVLLNTSSVANVTSSVTNNEFSQDNGIISIFPGDREYTSRLGDKRYLYPLSSSVASSTVIYDSDSDEFEYQTAIDTSKPYGELIVDHGVVILYRDIIKEDHANLNDDPDVGNFVAGFGGGNFIQLNGTIMTSNIKLNEFNYTTNPTFFEDDSPEIIKEQFRVNPVTYVTGVGVYNENNELIAFGRPSKPLKNSFADELVFKIELNY